MGNHDSILGFTTFGQLTTLHPVTPHPATFVGGGKQLLAMKGDGTMAITDPAGILEFSTFADLRFHIFHQKDRISSKTRELHLPPMVCPRMILATATSFILLSHRGCRDSYSFKPDYSTAAVYTWGSARFPHLLARTCTATSPAETPQLCESLSGIAVKKIVAAAVQGWFAGAVDTAGGAYIWGGMPGRGEEPVEKDLIGVIRGETKKHAGEEDGGAGEVTRIVLPLRDDGEERDIVDVAIGRNHVVVIAEGAGAREAWAIGENDCGQLGVGHEKQFVEDWTRVGIDIEDGTWSLQRVAAGPAASFVVAGRS